MNSLSTIIKETQCHIWKMLIPKLTCTLNSKMNMLYEDSRIFFFLNCNRKWASINFFDLWHQLNFFYNSFINCVSVNFVPIFNSLIVMAHMIDMGNKFQEILSRPCLIRAAVFWQHATEIHGNSWKTWQGNILPIYLIVQFYMYSCFIHDSPKQILWLQVNNAFT